MIYYRATENDMMIQTITSNLVTCNLPGSARLYNFEVMQFRTGRWFTVAHGMYLNTQSTL